MGNINFRSLKPGDVLEIGGIPGHSLRPHWAIYMGNGDIVHFTKDTIRRDDLTELCKSKSIGVKVRNYHDNQCQPKEWGEIIGSAENHVGTESAHVRWTGCKDFAIWCRYGEFIQNNIEAVSTSEEGGACFDDNDEQDTDARLLHYAD
ncbi:protein LRATD1-like [Glandiceps talaboti]